MAEIFRSGEEKPQARCRHRARISTVRAVYRACPTKRPVDVSPTERPKGRSEKDRQAGVINLLFSQTNCNR